MIILFGCVISGLIYLKLCDYKRQSLAFHNTRFWNNVAWSIVAEIPKEVFIRYWEKESVDYGHLVFLRHRFFIPKITRNWMKEYEALVADGENFKQMVDSEIKANNKN